MTAAEWRQIWEGIHDRLHSVSQQRSPFDVAGVVGCLAVDRSLDARFAGGQYSHVIVTDYNADDDTLTYSLDYSKDGGVTWTQLSSSLYTTTVSIDLDQLPGSPNGKFRVWASDGVNTATDETDGTFGVADKLPPIESVEPVSGTTYVVSQTISFAASAYDPEDGALADAQLEWSSDADPPGSWEPPGGFYGEDLAGFQKPARSL